MTPVCTGLCGACCLPEPTSRAVELHVPTRRHLPSLITVREHLERPDVHTVHVLFDDGSQHVTYTRRDLPAIRQKIIYSM